MASEKQNQHKHKDVLSEAQNAQIKKFIEIEEDFEKEKKELQKKLTDLAMENKLLNEQLERFQRVTEDILIRYSDISNKGTECETEYCEHTSMETIKGPTKTPYEMQHARDSQTESLKNLFEILENDKRHLLEQRSVLGERNGKLETHITQLELEKRYLQTQVESFETSTNHLKSEKDELLLRLSKFAGEKLAFNNPAIADLSDQNRPTKLGEFYSELYDNEWTNAFDGLEKGGYDETTAVETLRLTLESVMQFCESKAALLLQRASDAVNLIFEENKEFDMSLDMRVLPETMPNQLGQHFQHQVRRYQENIDRVKLQDRWKPKQNDKPKGQRPSSESEQEQTRIDADNKLKQLRKDMATSMIPVVQKAYIAAMWKNECIEELKPYIRKCLYLCWMMVVQSPPMDLHTFSREQEITFDKNMYRAYRKSGPLVYYVVWPALLLNKDGPLVCKGVAEGKTV